MKVDLNRLECRSVFDLALRPTVRVQPAEVSSGQSGEVRLAELEDVLFLPDVLERGQCVSVYDNRFVPAESVLDRSAVDFIKASKGRNPAYQPPHSDTIEPQRVNRRVSILANPFSRNFGHWTEELLKVAVLEQSSETCSYVIADGLPAFAAESLRLLGVEADRVLVVNTPTVFSTGVFTTAVSHDSLARYPDVLHQLRHIVDVRLGKPERAGGRLWLERVRDLRNGGVVVNRDEVFDCVRRYGFEPVDMASLPIADQLRLIRCATMIAGAHGAQFVHAQFMPRSSTVIECFSPMHVNPSALQICRVLGHSYHQVVARSHLIAPYQHGRDCVVDCEHLALLLDSLA